VAYYLWATMYIIIFVVRESGLAKDDDVSLKCQFVISQQIMLCKSAEHKDTQYGLGSFTPDFMNIWQCRTL